MTTSSNRKKKSQTAFDVLMMARDGLGIVPSAQIRRSGVARARASINGRIEEAKSHSRLARRLLPGVCVPGPGPGTVEGLTLDELPTGVLTQEEVDLLVKLYRQQMQADGPGGLAKRRCNWHDLCYQFNLAVKKNRVEDPSSADRLKLKTPALRKQAQERIAEQAHSRQLLEKSGLLEKYIRVRAWLKDSSQFDFAVPDLRLPGPALGPAAAAPAPAAAAAAPKLTHDAPLFQLDFAVNKDTSLQVLKRRQKVLAEFRHCLVCERPCQKKTNSGWEIVGDKHTAVPSSGRGWERYPSCEDQTLTAEEVKKQVKARAQKVWKMKIKVDNLIQKKNNKETK